MATKDSNPHSPGDEVSESDDAGVLLNQATAGTGFQLAGALQRLGRRMLALIGPGESSAAIKDIPMQYFATDWQDAAATVSAVTAPFATACLTLEPELSNGLAASSDRIVRLNDLGVALEAKQPGLRIVYVVPDRIAPADAEKLAQSTARATVLTSPVVFGFRDQALLDRALDFWKNRPGLLTRTSAFGAWDNLPLAYVGDVASFVVAALNRPETEGRVLALPANLRGLTQFVERFNAAFATPAPALLERLATKLSAESLTDALKSDPQSASTAVAPHTLATEVLPNPPSPPARIFDQLARLRAREPFLELVFPPARSI